LNKYLKITLCILGVILLGKEIVNKHGNLFILNNAFRDFIYQNDIANVLKDKEQCQVLQEQLIQLLIKENL
jgi:hypothetical protein